MKNRKNRARAWYFKTRSNEQRNELLIKKLGARENSALETDRNSLFTRRKLPLATIWWQNGYCSSKPEARERYERFGCLSILIQTSLFSNLESRKWPWRHPLLYASPLFISGLFILFTFSFSDDVTVSQSEVCLGGSTPCHLLKIVTQYNSWTFVI